jgi:pyruvate dehydrogenase E2 component (dihydrolipoamide acetyltransferase)
MAKIDVPMPQMGESIAEGTLSKWLKKVGDPVKRDEPIFEISTDKVDAEIPAPAAGVLAEILVKEGETVAVQTVVARLETDASAAATAAPAAPPPAAPAAKAPAAPAPPSAPAAAPAAKAPAAPAPPAAPSAPSAPPARNPEPAAAAPAASAKPPAPSSMEERLRTRSTPLVRKIAAEHNLDITGIPGSGLAGRVTKSDVLSYLDAGQPAAGIAPAAGGTAAPAPAAPAPGPGLQDGVRVVPGPVVEPWEGDRVEPWTRIRKLTADHMIMSRRVSAHVHSLIEVDYTRVAALRSRHKAGYTERGVNLTFLAFIATAVARTLRQHPVLNASVMGESTLYRRDINLGIAVALEWGLIVPVIRRADELNLLGTARAINDLGERARSKKLSPDEVQKGTFTITNPGVFGTLVGLPILNQPQSAILAVGAIGKRPAVVQAADGTDTIGIRTQGTLAMAFDHRIVDGADADRFLAAVRRTLEEFPDDAM